MKKDLSEMSITVVYVDSTVFWYNANNPTDIEYLIPFSDSSDKQYVGVNMNKTPNEVLTVGEGSTYLYVYTKNPSIMYVMKSIKLSDNDDKKNVRLVPIIVFTPANDITVEELLKCRHILHHLNDIDFSWYDVENIMDKSVLRNFSIKWA